jgi:tetratricopeptide (TPR) repeat protein
VTTHRLGLSGATRVSRATCGSLGALAVLSLGALAAPASAASGASGAGRATVGAAPGGAALAQLRAQVKTAQGPVAYGALRKIWSEWDRTDPEAIEEALREVGDDAAEPAPVRAYAHLLEAYARRRRGDVDGARARVSRLGFVGTWMAVGPFDNDGKIGLGAAYEPENDKNGALRVLSDYEGKEHHPVRWRLLPSVSPYGWVDFGSFVRPDENVCVYAAAFVSDARLKGAASRPVSLWAGATGALKVFWNGAPVLADDKYRDLDSDRFATTVTLSPGWNRLLVKVCGDDRSPMLSLRVAGPDGAPDDHLTVDADPRHSTKEGGAASASASATAKPGRTEGPLQAFERLAKSGDPATLEAYARYLVSTGADDPTEHRARELARRAADAAPTIPRLLLVAEVAENRNQRAAWIERAEQLAAARGAGVTDSDRIELLLARAAYTRTGVNPRDAMPFYEQALALDPDCFPATLAEVELYEAAGLRSTALAVLRGALARRPRSVGLLRAAVAALRDEGLEAEAGEVADRYAALRFDDPAFARGQIDLAVARRDGPAAAHWIDRLLAMSPDSSGALQTAAQAWMRLGDRARGMAALRGALDLAPDDTDVMRKLAQEHARGGERDEQLRLLKRVVELMPQAKDVRDELAHLGPPTPRADEAYARPATEFLAQRERPAGGQARRTLVDLHVTTVFPNGLASRFHQEVFQPLTDAAAASAREYELTYETDTETVQLRAARVYRKDGRVDEAIESGSGAMADDPAIAMYTSARSYYVLFPRIDPGDVVELQYRVEDVAQRNNLSDYFGEIVPMQAPEPIARAEYVLVTPRSRTLYFNEPRVPGLRRATEEQGDQRTYRFVALDVPAVEGEPMQPPWPEVLPHVSVSTFRTWDEMGRWYWGLVKDQFVPDDEVRRRAEALTAGMKDDASKVRAIYDYVVQNTRYVALEFGIHGYKPYRCAQIFARGFGDCKDKATLIVTMLGALGIKATPVIVRTGLKGDVESVPATLAAFDHMIAYVPSLDLYLDGTAEYTGSTELPAMDRSAIALQVNEGEAKLVRLPDPAAAASVNSRTVDAALAADGSAQLDWRAETSGVEASEWRVRFHAAATRAQRVQQLVSATMPGAEVTSVEASDLEDVEGKVAVHAHAHVPELARTEGDALAVPLGRKEHMVRDYAPLTERKLDVRTFARWTEQDDVTVHLPPGARVKSLPAAAQASGPFGSYSFEVQGSGGVVHAHTTVTFAQTRIAARDYPAFRAWCAEVDHQLGQRAMVTVR